MQPGICSSLDEELPRYGSHVTDEQQERLYFFFFLMLFLRFLSYVSS